MREDRNTETQIRYWINVKQNLKKCEKTKIFFDGATGENRTHDLTLTKGALYH